MFWSDLGPNVGYEAIGLVDATLPTVGVFAKHTETDTETKPVENVETSSSEGAPDTDKTSSSTTTTTTVVEPKSASDIDNYNKGVIFYLNKDEKVVGIVLWNVFNRINVARSIIAEGRKYDDLNEVAKLFEIYA